MILRSRCSPAPGGSVRSSAPRPGGCESSRVSQTSIPTCSLRMRMPPEAWPMLQRTDGPSTVASRVSSPSDDPDRLDLVALAEAAAGPLDGHAVAQGVGELLHQELEHDAQVGAVRGQLRDSHAEVEGGVSGSPAGSSDIERIVVAWSGCRSGGCGCDGARLGAGAEVGPRLFLRSRLRPAVAPGAARRSRRGCPGSSAAGNPRRTCRRRRSRARGRPSPRARRCGPASGGSCRTW